MFVNIILEWILTFYKKAMKTWQGCYLASAWTWAQTSEHDQIFSRIFFDTWHKIYHDVKKYFAMCTWANDNYGLKIWMNKINGWKEDDQHIKDENLKWMKN
jgi:hypothetical protein